MSTTHFFVEINLLFIEIQISCHNNYIIKQKSTTQGKIDHIMLPENLNKFLILLMWVENVEQQSVIGFGIVVGRII